MGKLIIIFQDNHRESFKCKSKEQAEEIVKKRLLVKTYTYYDTPNLRGVKLDVKKKVVKQEMSFEEMERIISKF